QNLKLGFDPAHTMVAQLTLPTAKYPDDARRASLVREVTTRIESIPGVQAASMAQSAPIGFVVLSPLLAEGQGFLPLTQRPLAQWNMTSPGYFRSHGIPVLSGRDFTWADDGHAPKVVIVNQALANKYWPNENALGKHITFTRLQVPFEVVGVVGDTRNGNIEREAQPMMFSAHAQWARPSMTIAVRTAAGDPAAVSKAVAAQVAVVDRDLPLTGIQPMETLVQNAMAQRKQTTYLIAAFAVLALILAVIGLYGVMAFSVAQRTAEIGIRQAIGAQRGDILWMVMGQGLRLSTIGVVLGIGAAALVTRLIARLLFQVSASDPVTFAAIAV